MGHFREKAEYTDHFGLSLKSLDSLKVGLTVYKFEARDREILNM